MMNASKNSIFTTVIKTPEIKGNPESIVDLPNIILVNKFTEESSKKFFEDFNKADSDNQDIIPIVIDSYGGYVYSLMAMIDCIKTSNKKIATISIGKSMSCGAILLSCGTEGYRFCSEKSTIMIHDVSSWASGKTEEVQVGAEESKRLNNEIYNILDINCGKNSGYFKELVHDKGHADWYLTSEEAKKHNLVNHIRIPKFEVKISSETKLV